MAGKKGIVNNPNGRPAGAGNLVTKDLKKKLAEFLIDNQDKLLKELSGLKGKEYVMAYQNLLKFVIPVAREDVENELDTEKIKALRARYSGKPTKNPDNE